MAFNPKPDKDIVYVSGDKRYKVVSFTEKEVVVIRLKSDNSEDSSSITWTERQWNGKNLRKESIGGEHVDDKSEKRSNSFTFDIDDDGNMTISQNGKPIKRFNVRGPEGKPGKDGMPGQDGAHGQKGQDGATGQPGKDGAPGEKGQDGAPGKDGAPGPEGKQGATGPKGEDGVYWYPEISEDGTQLRFINRNNTSDVTEWYNIKGSKGDTGSEGPRGKEGPAGPIFIPSVNSDGELSWSNTGHGLTNPTTRNIKGDKGDKGDKGATFHPVVKEGVLYWYDDKGNLAKGITPVRITGAQGKQGEQGAQGLSAYQIWLKQGYLGTEQDFLNSLKGDKGEPAPRADFSYLDVEDYTCAVQKIDTNLIVDSTEPSTTERIIEDRIEEIKNLRELGKNKRKESSHKNWIIASILLLIIGILGCFIGKKLSLKEPIVQCLSGVLVLCSLLSIGLWFFWPALKNCRSLKNGNSDNKKGGSKFTNAKVKSPHTNKKQEDVPKSGHIGLLKEFFWWCAGADRDLLAMCPGDHSKYVGIGTTILFTALMAWFSSFIAMQLVFPKEEWLHYLFATFWMLLIFSLDRFITNTMYSDGKVTISKKELVSGMPRIIIAIILGIIISAPLELKIFEKEIHEVIRENHKNTLLTNFTTDTTDLNKKFLELDNLILNIQRDSTKIIGWKEEVKKLDTEIKKAETEAGKVAEKKSTHVKPQGDGRGGVTNQDAVDKSVKQTTDNIQHAISNAAPNEKARMDSIQNLILEAEANYAHIETFINRRNDIRTKLNTKISAYETASTEASLVSYAEHAGLGKKITALHELGSKGYKPWFYKEKPSPADSLLLISANQKIANTHTSTLKSEVGKDTKVDDSLPDTLSKSEDGKETKMSDTLPDTLSKSEVGKETKMSDALPDTLSEAEKKVLDYKYGAENHKFAAAMDTIFHHWWWFLFNSAIGLIMLLFILIDISPVLYKMMLADGRYDNYLHQEKLLAQDKIRLSLANMLKGLNDSELKRVAPFVMGDVYSRMAGDSYVYKTEEEYKKEIVKQKETCLIWRIIPFSWIKAIFWKEDDKPSAPLINFTKDDDKKDVKSNINGEQSVETLLSTANREVFEEVLEMKKKIILASYRRWYKTQHDCIICDDINDENKGKEPFEEDSYPPRDTDKKATDEDLADDNHTETLDNEDEAMNSNAQHSTTSDEDTNHDPTGENAKETVGDTADDEDELPDDGDDLPKD